MAVTALKMAPIEASPPPKKKKLSAAVLEWLASPITPRRTPPRQIAPAQSWDDMPTPVDSVARLQSFAGTIEADKLERALRALHNGGRK